MKAVTKIHKQVEAIQKQIKSISSIKKKWAIENCLDKFATISRNRMFCLECGHKWKGSDYETKMALKQGYKEEYRLDCPSCKKSVKFINNDKFFTAFCLFAVYETFKKYQVIRVQTAYKHMSKNKPVKTYVSHELEYWIGKDGSLTLFSRNQNYGHYGYNFNGDMTLKPNNKMNDQNYDLDFHEKYIYPKKDILPEIYRNGFNGNFHEITPHKFFAFLLNDVYGETLYKTGNIDLFMFFVKNRRALTIKVWKAFIICNRHKFELNGNNINDWIDYIKLLNYFKKDIHNPHYCCPKNLDLVHNKYVLRKIKIDEEKDYLEKVKRIKKFEPDYEKQFKKFFKLCFTNGEIEIKPMLSVNQFYEEGTYFKHCIFTNEYFKKTESLMLSAKIKGVPMETIEVSLNSFKIIQARGKLNVPTKQTKEIRILVNSNMELIKECLNPIKKKPNFKRKVNKELI